MIDFLSLDPISPVAVRMSGDSATLRYQTRSTSSSAGPISPTRHGPRRSTSAGDGRWQIVWGQTTAIPNDLGLFLESLKPAS